MSVINAASLETEENLKDINLLPSEIVKGIFKLPDSKSKDGVSPFSFKGREYWIPTYDNNYSREFIIGARQIDKCAIGSSLVTMADGSLQKINKIRTGDRIWALNTSTGKSVITTVTRIYSNGKKECYNLKTRMGFENIVTGLHPYRKFGKWEISRNLREGDRIAVPRNLVAFGDLSVPKDRIIFTAYMIGEGTPGPDISFTSANPVTLKEFRSILDKLDIHYTTHDKKNTDAISIRMNKACERLGRYEYKYNEITKWLKADGLWGKRSGTQFIPDWVFQLPKNSLSLFLNRLWSTDGTNKLRKHCYEISYCSISKYLLRQLQSLLLKFGIVSTLRHFKPPLYKGTPKLAYSLRIEGRESVKIFLSEIGVFGKDVPEPPDWPSNSNRDVVPKEFHLTVENMRFLHKRGNSLKNLGIRRTPSYSPTWRNFEKYLEALLELGADPLKVKELRAQAGYSIYWDKVREIKPAGIHEVFNLETEEGSLVLDGIFTHNSTTLGNIALTLSTFIPGFRTLFGGPTYMQVEKFSRDRLSAPCTYAQTLNAIKGGTHRDSILSKKFRNGSEIVLRATYQTAERIRGIPADLLVLDEFQDLNIDFIPTFEECLFSSSYKLRRYCCNPKTLDNPAQYYWEESTQNEWLVPCNHHTPRVWNILGEKNLGLKHLICSRCGKEITPRHPDCKWVAMNPEPSARLPFVGRRVSQLMSPNLHWDEMMAKYEGAGGYTRSEFFRNVLALSYELGIKPITKDQLLANCASDMTMGFHEGMRNLKHFLRYSTIHPIAAGIDWGCYSEDTRTLTDRGFQFIDDIKDDDLIAQFDPDTEEISYVKPQKKILFQYEGDMLRFKGRNQDMLVTPDHGMLWRSKIKGQWKKSEAKSLNSKNRNLFFHRTGKWKGKEQKNFILPAVSRRNGFLSATQKPKKVIPMDLWLRFVGYAISEGGICLRPDKKTPCSFSITQRIVHPDEVKEIRAILNQLPFKCKECFNPKTGDYNWKVHDIQLYTWLAEHTGIFCDEKKIPRAFLSLSSRQLRLLFSTLMKGDGYWDPRYKNNGGYYTTSKRLADDVQELCLKIGLCTKVSLKSPAAGNRKDRWVVSISSGRMIELNSRRNIQTKHYKGRCYCFSVPSGFFITERNGCIAIQGNSGIRCFTVLTLGGYCGKNKFNIFYIHRFTGEDVDPERQLPQIIETLKQYNVKIVGADEGFGFASNDRLIRTFGPDRIQKYRYNKQKALIEWDSTGHWWQMDRSQIMSLFMRKLIDGNLIELPRAEEFHPEFGQDVLNIVSEFDEKRDRMTYTHHPKRPDDVFHSMLYCFLAMSILQPRPDIFRPQRGDA